MVTRWGGRAIEGHGALTIPGVIWMQWVGTSMGFFDLQVNGYAGVDFNGDDLDAERGCCCARLESEGVEGILVTIITDAPAAMEARLRAVVRLRESVPSLRQIMRGFHIEGPFLNPEDGYRGAHPLDAIRMADVRDGEAAGGGGRNGAGGDAGAGVRPGDGGYADIGTEKRLWYRRDIRMRRLRS